MGGEHRRREQAGAAPPSGSPRDCRRRAMPRLPPSAASPAGRRVLVVDDNATNRAASLQQLTLVGHDPGARRRRAAWKRCDAQSRTAKPSRSRSSTSRCRTCDGVELAGDPRIPRCAVRRGAAQSLRARGDAAVRRGRRRRLCTKPVRPARSARLLLVTVMAPSVHRRGADRETTHVADAHGPATSASWSPRTTRQPEGRPPQAGAAGLKPDFAVNGLEAVGQSATGRYDLDPDGLPDAGARRLRGDRADPPKRSGSRHTWIVAITAHAMAATAKNLHRRRHGRLHRQADATFKLLEDVMERHLAARSAAPRGETLP